MERRQLAGSLLVAAVASFILGNAIAILLDPTFNPNALPFSDLGAAGGATWIVWSSGIFLVGALTLSAGISLFGGTRETVPYLLAGLGWIVNSFFNFKAYPVEHGLSAVVAFVFSAIIAIGSFRIVKRPLGFVGVLCAVVILIATVFLIAGQGNVSGTFELLIIVPLFGWFLVLGVFLLGESSTHPSSRVST